MRAKPNEAAYRKHERLAMTRRVNILGDIRAERDRQMLQVAFYETPDYKTLIESTDRPIVVGRRGTGKSALCFQLAKYWKQGRTTNVIQIVPHEDQVIGIRPLLQVFGEKYNQIKAGAKIAWKYALLLEISGHLIGHYRYGKIDSEKELENHVLQWAKSGPTIYHRFRAMLEQQLAAGTSPEATIAGLAQKLNVAELQLLLQDILKSVKVEFVLLIDQLDEGYEADEVGGALVAGFVHAAIELNFQLPRFRA
jgi:hypothetical protein